MESAATDRGTTLQYKPVGTRGKKITTGMMAVPPHQRCVGSAPSSPPDLWCLLMMLVMKIGTIQALGVPPPQRCLGPAPGAPGWTGCLHSDVSVQSLREREGERHNIKNME